VIRPDRVATAANEALFSAHLERCPLWVDAVDRALLVADFIDSIGQSAT